jgi:hypothetical protein
MPADPPAAVVLAVGFALWFIAVDDRAPNVDECDRLWFTRRRGSTAWCSLSSGIPSDAGLGDVGLAHQQPCRSGDGDAAAGFAGSECFIAAWNA